ncbi:MAG TPA: VTT domain-containing protein [Clostridium perfringens]|nr:VTT domain-containing protein [Clostridium perfringens]
MSRENKVKIFKIFLAIIVLSLFLGIIIYLFPIMKDLSTLEGQITFKEKVENSGILGLLSLFGLQVAQIFLIIVPGEPIEILAGMCYGSLWGTVFIMLSACIISTTIFLLVRKFGRKFVYDFCDKSKVEKIENSKVFQNPKKIEFIMLILFLIPGTPKDLLVYVAGLLPIKPLKFIIISTFARFPSVITSTLAGENVAKR